MRDSPALLKKCINVMRERENPVNPTVFAGVSALEKTAAVLVRLPALRRNPSAGWGTNLEKGHLDHICGWSKKKRERQLRSTEPLRGFFRHLVFPPNKTGTGGGVSPGIPKWRENFSAGGVTYPCRDFFRRKA